MLWFLSGMLIDFRTLAWVQQAKFAIKFSNSQEFVKSQCQLGKLQAKSYQGEGLFAFQAFKSAAYVMPQPDNCTKLHAQTQRVQQSRTFADLARKIKNLFSSCFFRFSSNVFLSKFFGQETTGPLDLPLLNSDCAASNEDNLLVVWWSECRRLDVCAVSPSCSEYIVLDRTPVPCGPTWINRRTLPKEFHFITAT